MNDVWQKLRERRNNGGTDLSIFGVRHATDPYSCHVDYIAATATLTTWKAKKLLGEYWQGPESHRRVSGKKFPNFLALLNYVPYLLKIDHEHRKAGWCLPVTENGRVTKHIGPLFQQFNIEKWDTSR